MVKINFKELQYFVDVEHKESILIDARKEFSNFIYSKGNGIEALSVSLKILHSKGTEEFSDEEVKVIIENARMCKAAFFDSVNTAVESSKNEENKEETKETNKHD